jgi:hypothetical protein
MPHRGREGLLIIAHRGGVVDEHHSENSIKGLEEAIRRGYTHVEIDARLTGDGHVVCFHDDHLWRETGIRRRISAMPVAAVTKIVLPGSDEPIPTLETYLARCAGRIGIMIDLKGCSRRRDAPRYARAIEAGLTRYGLLEDALILVNEPPIHHQDLIAAHFLGKARVAWRKPLRATQRAAARMPDFAESFYVFNHGADFTAEDVAGFQALGLRVIVSINTGHYRIGNALKRGGRHLERMLAHGVDGLEIDSCYDHVFFDEP